MQPIGTAGYSTTNYAILGRMYEAVTGDTIEDGVTGLLCHPRDPTDLTAKLCRFAEMTSDARVEVIAGSAAAGFVTYVQRSQLFGFPDFISVKFIDLPSGGSTIAVFSRARDGKSDLDVNKKRVTRWVEQTQSRIA